MTKNNKIYNMSRTVSLSIYAITINKRGDKSNLAILNDYNNGQDFLSDVDNLICSWKKDAANGIANDPIQKTAEQAFRLARKDEKNYYLVKAGRYITGMIESGEYGTEEDGINVDSGETSFSKKKTDALMRPFFFGFFIPTDSKFGFLVIERISNYGIFSVLSSKLYEYYENTVNANDYVLNICPLSLDKLVKEKIKALKYEAKKIELTRVRKTDLKLSKLSNNIVDDNGISMSVVYNAPFKGVMQLAGFIEKLKSSRNEDDTLYQVDKDITCEDVKIVVNIQGNDKTLSLQHFETLGMSMDISNDVKYNAKGYPEYDSLKVQADILFTYIKEQFPKE